MDDIQDSPRLGDIVDGTAVTSCPRRGGLLRSAAVVSIAFSMLISIASVASADCGDGVLEAPAEQCDDGNVADGDCCSALCQYEPIDAPCTDGSVCTPSGVCDAAGGCVPGAPLIASRCDPSIGRSAWRLMIRDESGTDRDRIRLTITRNGVPGERSGLGDPSATTAYALCFFRGDTGEPAHEIAIPGGSGWKKKSRGWRFRLSSGSSTINGISSVRVGNARVQLRADGPDLVLPGPIAPDRYFDEPIHVGIVSSDEYCDVRTFNRARTNTSTRYVDRGRRDGN